jgi:hypothetical protein
MATNSRNGDVSKALGTLNLEGAGDDTCSWALAYAAAGMKIFPVRADKTPISDAALGLKHGFLDASVDSDLIRRWWAKYSFAEIGWAVPAEVVAVDIDMKNGSNGLRDFERLEGKPADEIETPQASSPTGGRHLFYETNGRRYRNRTRIGGGGLDTRTEGGYVVLPSPGNGRRWLKPLTVPMLPAPAWVPEDSDKGDPRPAAEAKAFAGESRYGRAALESACAAIIDAPNGTQAVTLHRECWSIGGLIAGGVLAYESTLKALTEAALNMATYGRPWTGLEKRVAKSVEGGLKNPRGIPEDEDWGAAPSDETLAGMLTPSQFEDVRVLRQMLIGRAVAEIEQAGNSEPANRALLTLGGRLRATRYVLSNPHEQTLRRMLAKKAF